MSVHPDLPSSEVGAGVLKAEGPAQHHGCFPPGRRQCLQVETFPAMSLCRDNAGEFPGTPSPEPAELLAHQVSSCRGWLVLQDGLEAPGQLAWVGHPCSSQSAMFQELR